MNIENQAEQTQENPINNSNNNQNQVDINKSQDQENASELENSMKDLLEKILTFLEKFIKTKEDLQIVEEKLNDYDNLESLMEIIKGVFIHLTEKVDETLEQANKSGGPGPSEGGNGNIQKEYEALEKIVQKHEQEIRTHIRLEQQLKLYAESLQSKLDEQEQNRSELLESTKKMISDLKRNNQQLNEQLQKTQGENEDLQKKLKHLQNENQQNSDKIAKFDYMQEKMAHLERMLQDKGSYRNMSENRDGGNSQGGALTSYGNYKKVNVDIDYSNKGKKSETPQPGMKQKSPSKEKRAPTPNIEQNKNSDYLKVKIEIGQKPNKKSDSFRNSYQRFYNQVKQAKDDNNKVGNKDLASIYTSSQQPLMPSSKQTSAQGQYSSKDYRTIQPNSFGNSQNSSYLQGKQHGHKQQLSQNQNAINLQNHNMQYQLNYQQNNNNNNQQQQQTQSASKNSSYSHKRSKSHTSHSNYRDTQQQKNIRNQQIINSSNNYSQGKQTTTDYSRISNTPEINDITSSGGVGNQNNNNTGLNMLKYNNLMQNNGNNNNQLPSQHNSHRGSSSNAHNYHHYNRSISSMQQ